MRPMRRSWRGAQAALVVLLLLLSAGTVWALYAPAPASGPAATAAPASPLTSSLVTHGDLIVKAGETYTIQSSPGNHFYYQGGNITVDAGGTLDVRNVTLSFVSYVADTGTPAQRLLHLYFFNDFGTVNLVNSTLTTNVDILSPYAKLNLTITGNFTARNSDLAFPGWIRASGAAAVLTLNDSSITANPAVSTLAEPSVLVGDTEWAANLIATGGAHVNLLGGWINDTYADDTQANGIPGMTNLTAHNVLLTDAANVTWPILSTSNSSAALATDWSYPDEAFGSGGAQINYSDTNPGGTNTDADLSLNYSGTVYLLGTMTFSGSGAGTIHVPLTTAALNALNAPGLLAYIDNTGSFNFPAKISLQFTVVSGPAVNVNMTGMSFAVYPALLPYDPSVSGAGTTLASINTAMDLTFADIPASSLQQSAPFPWLSNKLDVDDGAVAYLANLSVTNPQVNSFSPSAVQPDASSQAYLYRWAQFNLTGRGGYLPIYGGKVVAHYAYPSSQANNATVTALNDLATTSPAIWGYVQYLDSARGVPGYGMSGRTGAAQLLLASTNITASTLPDGLFLGTYHVNVTIPIATQNSAAFNWSVSPYPSGVANGSSLYGTPDFAPPLTFPGYYTSVSVTSTTLTSNGTAIPAAGIDDYRVLGVNATITDTGTADVFNYTGTLTTVGFQGSPVYLLDSVPLTNITLGPGQSTSVQFDWLVNTTVTGLAGLVNHTFTSQIVYNGGTAKLGGGNLTQGNTVTVTPYTANFTASANLTGNGTALVGSLVRIGQGLGVIVTLTYSGAATVTSLAGALYYGAFNSTARQLGKAVSLTHLALNTPGQTVAVQFNWTVNESTVGDHGATILQNLVLALVWNSGEPAIGGSAGTYAIPVHIAPSTVAIKSFSNPPSTIDLSTPYDSSGYVYYNGSGSAVILLQATPVGGGVPVTIAEAGGGPGAFSLPWFPLSNLLSPGTTYSLTVNASYNGAWDVYSVPVDITVPSSSSPVSSILFEKFLGLPLWIWLAIAAAVVVALVALLFVSRRQAAGKLVECGECGNLIPEEATVCPKCGAEFESDLIRCSRCASTIPANSKFCPECAAQLLGKPGEGGEDAERQGYADFTEKYRAEAKRELGENYNEGSFWDWWKRQPTYTSYSQWKLQQGAGTSRAGMAAPPTETETLAAAPAAAPPRTRSPPKGGGGTGGAAATTGPVDSTAGSAPPTATPSPAAPAAGGAPPAAAPSGTSGLKPCPNCGNEIPPEYLVCPFCGSVTQ